jgi:Flp pilus assembly protein TadD
MQRVTREANRGRYSQAIRLLQQYLEQVPTNVTARRNLGMAYLEMGESKKAEQHIMEALNLDPQDAYSLLLIGNIYLQQKNKPDVGERFFRKASEPAPNDASIPSNLGSLMAQREEYEDARSYFHQAIVVDLVHPHAHYSLPPIHPQILSAFYVLSTSRQDIPLQKWQLRLL